VILGTVLGTVWATHLHPQLSGHRLVLVQPHGATNMAPSSDALIVASDRLSSTPGDRVVLSIGQAVRADSGCSFLPADAAVVLIIDQDVA